MNETPNPNATGSAMAFRYAGTTDAGQPIQGTLTSTSPDEARATLEELGVRITELAAQPASRRGMPIRGESLLALNQQIAYLTSAGVPLSRGLRALSTEAIRPSVRAAIEQVAERVEHGVSLGEAFEQQRGRFPRLYGRLIDAGIASHDLPGVLFALGRHMEMVARLRSAIWLAMAYPLVVLAVLGLVVLGVTTLILPGFVDIFEDFAMLMPPITRFVLTVGPYAGALAIVMVIVAVAVPIVAGLAHTTGLATWLADAALLPVPLLGPAIRRSLAARWCDAAHIAVGAGLPLPQAAELASDAIGSPSLSADTQALIRHIEAGCPPEHRPRMRILTDSVAAAIELGRDQRMLSETLASLGELYRRQVVERVGAINHTLPVLLLMLTGVVVGFVVLALFLPLVRLFSGLM